MEERAGFIHSNVIGIRERKNRLAVHRLQRQPKVY